MNGAIMDGELTVETNARYRVTMQSGDSFIAGLGEVVYARWGDRIVSIVKVEGQRPDSSTDGKE